MLSKFKIKKIFLQFFHNFSTRSLDAPIFLFIHGGYWQEFTKNLSAFAATTFVSKGIKVIVGGYDLCPNGTLLNYFSYNNQVNVICK